MYLLDTDVVSELRKVKAGKAHPNVVAWNETVAPSETFLSSISILELERGILGLERRDAAQGAVLRRWMSEHVLPTFAGRVLTIDVAVAQRCAKLHVPDPKPERDALIAASALVHRMTLVTRNVEDFGPMGVEILNPWEPAGSRNRYPQVHEPSKPPGKRLHRSRQTPEQPQPLLTALDAEMTGRGAAEPPAFPPRFSRGSC